MDISKKVENTFLSEKPIVSHDYEELIEEIEDELVYGYLSSRDEIQILRSDDGWIIDWYRSEEDLEYVFDSENPIDIQIKKDYHKDKPFLKETIVEEMLAEMREKNRLI